MQRGGGPLLHSKERVTQGNLLATIVYAIVILTLIRELQETHPLVMQPLHADNTGARVSISNIHSHTENLMVSFPDRGYFLEQTKSILVVSEKSVYKAQSFF